MISFQKAALSLSLFFLFGCQTVPSNLHNNHQDRDLQFERVVEDVVFASADSSRLLLPSSNAASVFNLSSVLAEGDTIRVSSQQFPELNGLRQIAHGGRLSLPGLEDLVVGGFNERQAEAAIKAHLQLKRWLTGDWSDLHISVVEQAPIHVSVNGAVFNPGRIVMNVPSQDKSETAIRQTTGAHSYGRSLLEALRNAGGVRPDADLNAVMVERGQHTLVLDLTPILNGDESGPIPLLTNGDRITVFSLGLEQGSLIRPSAITPPGMRVFMSNLTAPALNNAQSAIGNDASRLPYGVSLLDAAISANCVGGTHMANASRGIVLVTRNYGSKKQLVIHRKINELLAHSADTRVNPFVMPNDGVACFDSRFTNFRDVARGLGDLISPIILGRLL